MRSHQYKIQANEEMRLRRVEAQGEAKDISGDKVCGNSGATGQMVEDRNVGIRGIKRDLCHMGRK